MRRPVLATLFEKSKSIPVERPGDLAKNGKGTIKFKSNVSVIGQNTKFLEEFQEGD